MNQMPLLFIYSAKSVGIILIAACAGAILIRTNAIKRESLQTLSKLVFFLMLPCLLFTKVAKSVHLESIAQFYILPVSCVIYIFAGLFLGYLAAKLFKIKKEIFFLPVAASGFGNSGFIPIPLVAAICAIVPVLAKNPGSEALGISYISVYLLGFSPLMWTLGYSLISGRKLHKISISQIFTPPVIGMALGLIVGIAPFLKNNICQNTGLINPLFKAVEIIAQGTIPCALIILGGNFASSKIGKPESIKPIFLTVVVKLVILPLLAIFYVKLLFNIGLLHKSLLIALVLIIEAAVPSANNLVVICTLEKNHENSMTGILFWNYLISIVSMTFYIMLALWIFQ